MTPSPVASLVGPDGSVYGTELDIEGLLVLGDGSVMVVSEGSGEIENTAGPFVHRFDRGEYVGELTLPSWILPSVDGTSGLSPGNGPHGIALLPGSPGEVVVIMETSLQQDLDAGDGRIVRLIAFDVATGEPTRQWGYRLEPPMEALDAAIVDMAAVDGRSIVVVERDGSVEPGRRALYRIELDAGVEPGDSVPPTVEKHRIDVSAASSFSEIRWSSMSSGRRTADGNPTIVLMSNTAYSGEPTVGLVLELTTSS